MATQGENLKLIREALGLSQADLAKLAGIPNKSQVSHLECSRRGIGLKNRRRIAQAVNVPLEELTRMLQSEGNPELIRAWVRVHKVHSDRRTALISAFNELLSVSEKEASGRIPQEFLDNLLDQIRAQAAMAEKLSP